MLRSLLLAAALVSFARADGPTVLTASNFDEMVYSSGKSVFVKFFAPWCGHCKAMKPDWDKLAGEYADSSTVMIADVDCTVEKDLCSKNGVKGYPTLKYFQEDDGSAYQSGRKYDALKEFVEKTLTAPICNSNNKAACTPEDLAELDKWEKVSPEERKAEIERIEVEVKAVEKAHETLLEDLQKQYETSKKETEEKVVELSKPLRYLKKIKDAAAEKDEV